MTQRKLTNAKFLETYPLGEYVEVQESFNINHHMIYYKHTPKDWNLAPDFAHHIGQVVANDGMFATVQFTFWPEKIYELLFQEDELRVYEEQSNQTMES